MKRSEMIKEIKAIIRANNYWISYYNQGEISFGVMAEKLSEQILNHIEEKGMIPPLYEFEYGTGKVNSEGGELTDLAQMYEWEDE